MGHHRVLACVGITLVSCNPLGSVPPDVPEPAGDPTPLAKCQVAASQSNPLVTEWPASEKAHLQSLASRHVVAVAYTGCELRIIPECNVPGTYDWHRTTLATDTLEIRNADELYAKLPIGAISLEGELARSGQLAVQTTVAGQLRAESAGTLPASEACRSATHFVSAISVGAFKLLSGAQSATAGGAGIGGVGAGARHEGGKQVLRTAGDPDACGKEADAGPNVECASPIQLFLTRIDSDSQAGESVAGAIPRAPASDSDRVMIDFPGPDDASEHWTLRNADGVAVCTVPCRTWVPRVSGYTLRRENPLAELPLPGKIQLAPGSSAAAGYRAEQGSPTLSALNFYFVGLPTAGVSVGFAIWGATQVGAECEDSLGRPDDCFPGAGMLFATSIMMAALAGASTWWYLYSHEAELTIVPSASPNSPPATGWVVTPRGVGMTF